MFTCHFMLFIMQPQMFSVTLMLHLKPPLVKLIFVPIIISDEDNNDNSYVDPQYGCDVCG